MKDITLSSNVSSDTFEGCLEFQGYFPDCIGLSCLYELHFVITYVPNLKLCSSITCFPPLGHLSSSPLTPNSYKNQPCFCVPN